MRKMFRTFALLLASLLTVPMLTGCGGDDGDSEERVASANFVTATPPAGSTIIPNGSIILTFDNAPADVTISAGTIKVAGKSATITGPFTAGFLTLIVTWADGTQALNYTVTSPD